jgi:hypothetical protein
VLRQACLYAALAAFMFNKAGSGIRSDRLQTTTPKRGVRFQPLCEHNNSCACRAIMQQQQQQQQQSNKGGGLPVSGVMGR